MIGTDEFGNTISKIYHCNHGFCNEIHNLTCERRCKDKKTNDTKDFNTKGKNTFIFNGERVIIARLDKTLIFI